MAIWSPRKPAPVSLCSFGYSLSVFPAHSLRTGPTASVSAPPRSTVRLGFSNQSQIPAPTWLSTALTGHSKLSSGLHRHEAHGAQAYMQGKENKTKTNQKTTHTHKIKPRERRGWGSKGSCFQSAFKPSGATHLCPLGQASVCLLAFLMAVCQLGPTPHCPG